MIPRFPGVAVTALCLLCLAAGSAHAQVTPKTPPPDIGEAELQADGTLKVWISSPIPIPETRQVEEIVNGKAQPKLDTVVRWFSHVVEKQLTADRYLVIPVGGEKQDQAAVKALFGKRTPALFVGHGKLLDPHYAASFRPGTPVVYIRRNVRWSSMGPMDLDQQAAVALDVTPGNLSTQIAMAPRPAVVHVANGQLHVETSAWSEFPLCSEKDIPVDVTTPEGPRTVLKKGLTTQSFWAPTPQDQAYPLSACQVLTAAGQVQPDFDWSTVSNPIAAFWIPREASLDPRFARFLQGNPLIVQTSTPQSTTFPFGSACGPILDFRIAAIEGDQIRFARPIFERHVKKVAYTEVVNGVETVRERDEFYTVSKFVHTSEPLGKFNAMNGAGRDVPEPQLREHLKASTPVLVSDFPSVSPSQLRVLSPSTIILKPKPASNPGEILPAHPSPISESPAPSNAPPPPSSSSPPGA